MNRAPQYWTSLPAGFPEAPKVLKLRDEFGPLGPYVVIVLLAQATSQGYSRGEPKGGRVAGAWSLLAYLAGGDEVTVRAVVARWAEMGEIELAHDDARYAARFVEWELWHRAPADPDAARRKREQRDTPAVGHFGNVPDGHVKDRKGQNRKGQNL